MSFILDHSKSTNVDFWNIFQWLKIWPKHGQGCNCYTLLERPLSLVYDRRYFQNRYLAGTFRYTFSKKLEKRGKNRRNSKHLTMIKFSVLSVNCQRRRLFIVNLGRQIQKNHPLKSISWWIHRKLVVFDWFMWNFRIPFTLDKRKNRKICKIQFSRNDLSLKSARTKIVTLLKI